MFFFLFYFIVIVIIVVVIATLGPPSNDPFDKIVSKAQSEQNVKDDGEGNDELKLTLYRDGTSTSHDYFRIFAYLHLFPITLVHCAGFTVDDGPFRDKENPENVAFMEELMKGFIPSDVSLA